MAVTNAPDPRRVDPVARNSAAAGAATPPATSTLPPTEPEQPGAPMAILAILAVIFCASVAAADRGKRTRRRR